jgi:hypothetical protein
MLVLALGIQSTPFGLYNAGSVFVVAPYEILKSPTAAHLHGGVVGELFHGGHEDLNTSGASDAALVVLIQCQILECSPAGSLYECVVGEALHRLDNGEESTGETNGDTVGNI